ncbi:hypothetical protein GDO78_019508 [Eleutherodactylus coqui]|uniref:Uncharacterized protein n=1 Tax=Eleutherodactylus coqui TaxID=57060 RepID=A0A8J6EQH9_ELECQ|nr:hypothetical protein GDO78_019508 [Eleutherodactylus coqui]
MQLATATLSLSHINVYQSCKQQALNKRVPVESTGVFVTSIFHMVGLWHMCFNCFITCHCTRYNPLFQKSSLFVVIEQSHDFSKFLVCKLKKFVCHFLLYACHNQNWPQDGSREPLANISVSESMISPLCIGFIRAL